MLRFAALGDEMDVGGTFPVDPDGQRIEGGQGIVGQGIAQRRKVLINSRGTAGAGDRYDAQAEFQASRGQPGERHLRIGEPFGRRDRGNRGQQVEVLFQMSRGKTREIASGIGLGKLSGILDLPADESASQRRVGHESDTQAAGGGEQLVFHVSAEQGVLALHRSDRMDQMGALQFLAGYF